MHLFEVRAIDGTGAVIERREFVSFKLAVGVAAHFKQVRPDLTVIVTGMMGDVYRVF